MSTACDTWRPVVPHGDTWRAALTWTAAGDPVDLTGYTAALVASQNGEIIFSLSTETDGGLELGGPAGTITLACQLGETPKGRYELRLTVTSPPGTGDDGGTVTTLIITELAIV